MIDRFLLYSFEHRRKIALMVMDEKGVKRLNVTVVSIGDEAIEYVTSRSDKRKSVAINDILSAAYARGDDGDTLKNEQMEKENG